MVLLSRNLWICGGAPDLELGSLGLSSKQVEITLGPARSCYTTKLGFPSSAAGLTLLNPMEQAKVNEVAQSKSAGGP